MVHKELTAKEKALLVKHVSKDKSKLLKLDKPSESAEVIRFYHSLLLSLYDCQESKKKSWKLRLSIKKNKTPKIKEPKQPEVSKKR